MTVEELIAALQREPKFINVYVEKRRRDYVIRKTVTDLINVCVVVLEGPYVVLALEE